MSKQGNQEDFRACMTKIAFDTGFVVVVESKLTFRSREGVIYAGA
jgi:hypothetical protein